MLTDTPLESLLHFDFNNNVHMVLVLALVVVLFLAVRTVYKEVRRIARKAKRSYGKLVAAGVVGAGSGGALTDAFGIPSNIIEQLGWATTLL